MPTVLPAAQPTVDPYFALVRIVRAPSWLDLMPGAWAILLSRNFQFSAVCLVV